MLASLAFIANLRASAFLAFVVEEVLGGAPMELSRPPSGVKSSGVRHRTTWRNLADGAADLIRIEIPREATLHRLCRGMGGPAQAAVDTDLPQPSQSNGGRTAAASPPALQGELRNRPVKP
jgi:hypothetical protein